MIGDPLDLQHVGGFFTMKVAWQNHHGVLVDGRETTEKKLNLNFLDLWDFQNLQGS